jgi:hypothetical protein
MKDRRKFKKYKQRRRPLIPMLDDEGYFERDVDYRRIKNGDDLPI